jgi:hypothetical protein
MSVKINFPPPTGSNAVYGPKRRIHSKEVPNFEKCTVYIQEMMKSQYDSKTQYLQLEYKVDDDWCVIDSNETYQCALAEFDKVLEMVVLIKELTLVATEVNPLLEPPVGTSDTATASNNVSKDTQTKPIARDQDNGTLTPTAAIHPVQPQPQLVPECAQTEAEKTKNGIVLPVTTTPAAPIGKCPEPNELRTSPPIRTFRIGERVYSRFILSGLKTARESCNHPTMSQKFYPAIVEAYDAKNRSYTVFFPNDYDRYTNIGEQHLRSIKEVKFDIDDLVEWSNSEMDKSRLWRIRCFDEKTGNYSLTDPKDTYKSSEYDTKVAKSYAELNLVQSEQRYSNSVQVYLHSTPFIVVHYNNQNRTYSLINPAEAAQWSAGTVQLKTVPVDKIYGERLPTITEKNFSSAAEKIYKRFSSSDVWNETVWNVYNWTDFYYSNVAKALEGTRHYRVIAEQFYHRSTNRHTISNLDKLCIPQTENGQLLQLKSFIEFCVKSSPLLVWQWLFAQGFNTQFAHKEYQFVVGEIVYARNHSGTKVNANAVQCKVVQVDPDEDKLELQPLEESVQLTYMYPVFSVCKKLVCPNVQGCHHCVDERNATKLAANVVCICNGKRFVTID